MTEKFAPHLAQHNPLPATGLCQDFTQLSGGGSIQIKIEITQAVAAACCCPHQNDMRVQKTLKSFFTLTCHERSREGVRSFHPSALFWEPLQRTRRIHIKRNHFNTIHELIFLCKRQPRHQVLWLDITVNINLNITVTKAEADKPKRFVWPRKKVKVSNSWRDLWLRLWLRLLCCCAALERWRWQCHWPLSYQI